MNILEISHCRKQFDGVQVLSDISLTVDEGQVVSIIGPSGSGKSTLLRCATLLETMDGGSLAYMEMFSIGKQIANSQSSFTPFIIAGVFYYLMNSVVAFAMSRCEKALGYYR